MNHPVDFRKLVDAHATTATKEWRQSLVVLAEYFWSQLEPEDLPRYILKQEARKYAMVTQEYVVYLAAKAYLEGKL